MPDQKPLTLNEARIKIGNFCAYQERYQQEVRDKLYSYGLTTPEVEDLISYLITEGYLNELRFSKAFAGGKFRIKKWGKVKISLELKRRNLTDRCIDMGLAEIDDESYRQTLMLLIETKSPTVEGTLYERQSRLARYAISKGYEPELVWETVRSIVTE